MTDPTCSTKNGSPTSNPSPTTAADVVSDIDEQERSVRLQELSARRAEAEAKLKTASTPWWRGADPLLLAVAAGILTLGGNAGVAYWNSKSALLQEYTKAKNALDLEKEKAKATLILQAVATNDPTTARRNMLFFLDSEIIKDEDRKIRMALEKYAPVLPSASGQSSKSPPNSPAEYEDDFWTTTIRPEWISQVDVAADKIINAKTRLERVAEVTHTPWYLIGILWVAETGGDFTKHLHNGDSLKARTVHVPANRPETWPAPSGMDDWEYSAIDAINLFKMNNLEQIQLGEILSRIERLHGLGYQKQGMFSPDLWAGTDLYEKGRYMADHLFAPEAVSKYPGAAALLRRLSDRGIIDLRKTKTATASPQ